MLKIESRAAAGVLAQARRETAALEAMLAERDRELEERGRQLETATGELERLRATIAARQAALHAIAAQANELL